MGASCPFVRVYSWLLLSSHFWHLDPTAKGEQPDRCDGCGAGEDQPHHRRATFAVLGTERGEHPTARADEKFAEQKWNVRECAVGSFLARRRNGRGVFINTRRIKRFTDREHGEIKRGHDVVGVNRAGQSQITVAEASSERAV